MSFETFFSEDNLLRGRIRKSLLPFLLVIFLMFFSNITLHYYMQNLQQKEIKLKSDYQKLRGTAVVTHENMIKETDIDNIKVLIQKYKLNIKTETVSPILVQK